jgi:hypothetical protein
VVSVLASRPKVFGFKPGQGDGFLEEIKIHCTPSFGSHVVRYYDMLKISWKSHGTRSRDVSVIGPPES